MRTLLIGLFAIVAISFFPCDSLTSFAWANDSNDRAGRRIPTEMKQYRDEKTGRIVTALTTDRGTDGKLDQTHPSWTSDGKWIVFTSQRTGRTQLFAAKESTGDLLQLTEGPYNHGLACLSRRSNSLLSIEDRKIIHVDFSKSLGDDLNSPETAPAIKVVGEFPAGAKLDGLPTWDAEERLLYVFLEWPDQPQWKRWTIHALDLLSGQFSAMFEQGSRLEHLQANPYVTGLLMFDYDMVGEFDNRIWVARTDKTEYRHYYKAAVSEWAGHEVWWDEERALFTIWPRDEKINPMPHGIASINLAGGSRTHSLFPFWHVTGVRNAPWLAGDTPEGEIFRIHHWTGEQLLLTQGHRVQRTGAHPNPTIRPDGNRVLFMSHFFGNPDLFLVDIPDAKE